MPGVVPGRRALIVLAHGAHAQLSRFASPRAYHVVGPHAGGYRGISAYDLDPGSGDEVRRSAIAELASLAGVSHEIYVSIASLDAQAEPRLAADPENTSDFAVLSNAPEAIEDVFNRLYKNADMAAILRLPGALSVRRYALHPPIGREAWEMLTFCRFEKKPGFDPAEGITDCLGESDALVTHHVP